jgi:hypothetical protein
MVLGGQQILEGPVGAVPVGQTQWSVTVSKSIPAGQQGRLMIASWFKAREDAKASRATKVMTDLFIKIFQIMKTLNLFDLNKKH